MRAKCLKNQFLTSDNNSTTQVSIFLLVPFTCDTIIFASFLLLFFLPCFHELKS